MKGNGEAIHSGNSDQSSARLTQDGGISLPQNDAKAAPVIAQAKAKAEAKPETSTADSPPPKAAAESKSEETLPPVPGPVAQGTNPHPSQG